MGRQTVQGLFRVLRTPKLYNLYNNSYLYKLVRLVQPCASLYANYANYSYRASLYKSCTSRTRLYSLYNCTSLVRACTRTRLYVQACILACTRRIVQVLYKALHNHKQACTTTSKLGEVTRSKRTNVCSKAYVYSRTY